MPSWKKFLSLFLFLFALSQAKLVIVDRLPTKDKVIALTFDDGPKNGPTEILLDLLQKENLHATFFIVGRSIKNDPDLVFRLKKEGHTIANHTYSHQRLDTLNKNNIHQELAENNRLIKSITNTQPKFFRAPGGRYNADVYQAAQDNNLIIVNWSLNTGDYNLDAPLYQEGEAVFVRPSETIEASILNRVQPGDIILMHTGSQETIDALKKVIPELKNRGFKFVKIDDFY